MTKETETIHEALLWVQQQLKPVQKDASNDYFHSRYYTLDALLETLKPLLNEVGLVLKQEAPEVMSPSGNTVMLAVESQLLHVQSKSTVSSRIWLPVARDDPQAAGAAITYGRRYSLAALFAVAADQDDDAERAMARSSSGNASNNTPRQTTPQAAPQQQQQQQARAAGGVPSCPICGGAMWDNREGKRNPKAPDFKCKDRSCDGAIWPPKAGASRSGDAKGKFLRGDEDQIAEGMGSDEWGDDLPF